MIVGIIIVFICLAFFEIPGLIRKKYWRELIAFSCLSLITFTMTIIQSVSINIPSPMKGIEYIIRDIVGL
ncbi:hypothetical protein [Clostridium grantii]|uniref:Uncharacterized protein n=1 Tax=Clostridium grantii DSM 8605 TaxID=1121316 RepID=A0A1M5VQN5_9CLOT|nr:hypothetical protein [Clostridium grantii]SHH77555.1 hypothetical protein SAMN02745207_02447 [Clostridium grantii DSM 8605]